MDYDFVGKVETLSRDFWRILEVNHLESKLSPEEIVGVVLNPTEKEDDRTARHMAQLSDKLLWKVWKFYEKDFLLFDYDARPYMRGLLK